MLICIMKFFRFQLLLLVISTNTISVFSQDDGGRSKLPVISIASGMLNFSGDFSNTYLNQPLIAKSGIQIEVQKHTTNRLSFSAFFLTGKLSADHPARGLNFKTTIFNEGLMMRYDFISRKSNDQVLIPFLTAGIEYVFFRTKSDLKDANGVAYNYWTDGTIRSASETDPLSGDAVQLYRDYEYETTLRDANLDGTGKYKEAALAFPVGAGLRFKISEKCALHFSSVWHFTQTDYLDGVTAEGSLNRKGNDRNDRFFYTSVSFRYDLSVKSSSRSKSSKKLDIDISGVNFDSITNEDADGDGIPDVKDDSSGTPLYNKVDAKGKPFDLDDDGIPDYRDKELNSPKNAVVNEEGITITEEMIEVKFRRDSLAALPAVIEYLKSYDRLADRKPEVVQQWVDEAKKEAANKPQAVIPPIYAGLDSDKNGVITPKEISVAIDEYINKQSTYTIQQFFDLIDFFFSQK